MKAALGLPLLEGPEDTGQALGPSEPNAPPGHLAAAMTCCSWAWQGLKDWESREGSCMQGTLILYKPFHFVHLEDTLQNCLASAEWLSCLDGQSPQGKTNTMTTTVTPAEQKAWLSTKVRERSKLPLPESDPLLREAWGSGWRRTGWGRKKVGHQGCQVGCAEVHCMHLNEPGG